MDIKTTSFKNLNEILTDIESVIKYLAASLLR